MEWAKKEENWYVPIKSWCADIEDNAMSQAIDLAMHPVVFHHVAILPDCHMGYGMPIGGIIACNDVIIPNSVGVDISCGMIAQKTHFPVSDITTDLVKQIMGIVRDNVPVGFKHNKKNQTWEGFDRAPDIAIVQQQLASARKQLGTLGGGNHFIELQAGDDGYIWLMVHSGSRNFGYKIAAEYNKKAVALCEKWFSDIPNKELAFLPMDTIEGEEYFKCMNYALEFAMENRQKIMGHFKKAVWKVLDCNFSLEQININHNFAAMEHHFNKNVMIHRKGATKAMKGQKGIIPGSMGTSSYIVEGLGNEDSFFSCSHGAGRTMGRKEASRKLIVEDCDKAMEGVVWGRWGKDRKGNIDLGEAPAAYKDIHTVMEAQVDLVKPLVELKPLGVIKG